MDANTSITNHRMLETPDGVAISVQEWGNLSGPAILFIHGFSQSHMSWQKQYESELSERFRMITYDLRGHGGSDKPKEVACYHESKRWAGEVDCIIRHLELSRPVLVGWSYAGRVIGDYLLSYGDADLGGVVLVCGAACWLPGVEYPAANLLGGMTSEHLATNIASTRAFLRCCSVEPLSGEEFETTLAFNMAVPAYVRSNMFGRPMIYDEAYGSLTVPALVVHGEQDQIVPAAIGHSMTSIIHRARTSFYADAGHMPFWEDTERFNRELAEFVAACSA